MSSPRDVPVDYGFRDVTAPDSAFSEGRALEQIHKLLQAEPGERFAVRNSALSVAGSRAAGPLMILGIMSGHEGRRRVLRCTWGRAPEVRKYLRVLFVVGSMEPLKSEWEFEPAQQVSDPGSIARLRVNISEGVRVWKARPGSRQADRKHQSFTGTFSTYFKQAAFLRFAATQPEPLIGRADDDAFISPHMLLSYAHLLSTLKHPLYGGVFEWISWRAAKLEATGFSYGLSEARGRAKAPHRNCSREVPDAESPAYDHACLGPFACTRALASFASLLLAQLPLFSSDLALASALLLSCAAHALPSVSRALFRGFRRQGSSARNEPESACLAHPCANLSSRPAAGARYGLRPCADAQRADRRRHQLGLLDGPYAGASHRALPPRRVEGHVARRVRPCDASRGSQAAMVAACRGAQHDDANVAERSRSADYCSLPRRRAAVHQLLPRPKPTSVCRRDRAGDHGNVSGVHTRTQEGHGLSHLRARVAPG